jgi:excisionase family DNA binding protein
MRDVSTAGKLIQIHGTATIESEDRRVTRPVPFLTIEEAARYLNVSKTSLRRWTNSGRLQCSRIGVRGERRFSRADLDAFLASSYDVVRAADRGDSRPAMVALDDAARTGVVRHVCSHFRDVAESWRLFRPYFVHHAERGAPVFYIHDSTSREQFDGFVREEGYDPDGLRARGLLELVHSSQAYLRTGEFTVAGMLAFVEGAIEKLTALGHRTMLISGEMTWSLAGSPGSGGMIRYEELLNDLLAKYPDVTIVCHYSMERFGAELTLEALCAHPHVQLPDRLARGLYACPPATALNRGSM